MDDGKKTALIDLNENDNESNVVSNKISNERRNKGRRSTEMDAHRNEGMPEKRL